MRYTFCGIAALTICSFIPAASASSLIPFGSAAGDQLLGKCDDCFFNVDTGAYGGSGAIPGTGNATALDFSQLGFQFYGNTPSDIYIDNNGLLSLAEGVQTWVGQHFPISPSVGPLIAPFWGDVDTRSATGGNVWYRMDQSPDHNNEFVVTWDAVGVYEQNDAFTATFQAILETIGDQSFVTFNYGTLQWLTGDAGGPPPQVGFDAGDGVNYYDGPASQTPAVLNLTNGTNYAGAFGSFAAYDYGTATGRYVFEVSGNAPIAPPAVPEPSTFVITSGGLFALVFGLRSRRQASSRS
jgi:hypothetical protein